MYAQGPLEPGRLAIYFGFPSAVNGAGGDVNAAAAAFDDYDVVILGAWLHLPQYDPGDPGSNPYFDNGCTQNAHFDHDNTTAIINLLTPATAVYGYVSLGGENTARICPSTAPAPTPLSDLEIQTAIDQWQAMGVTGIFLDEAGYDFGTTRTRQNTAIDYAHSKGLPVFLNAFNPDDIFSDDVVGNIVYPFGSNLGGQTSSQPMNPAGTPTSLGPNDLFLLESFQIIHNNFQDAGFWEDLADKALYYKNLHGTKVATVTTISDGLPAADPCNSYFDQTKFDYAWWSTFIHGFDYMGWGEPNAFSASGPCDAELPWRSAPVTGGSGSAFSAPVVTHDLETHTRETDAGLIVLYTATHTGQFTSVSPPPPNPGPGIPPPPDMTTWWAGDEDATDLVGSNDGALSPKKSWFAPGKVDGAFSFDGFNDFIAFGNGPSLTGAGAFSIDAWVKTLDADGAIIQQRDATASGYDGEYALFISAGKVCCYTYDAVNGYGLNFCSSQSVNDGYFHLIALTRDDSGNGALYIDGVADNSMTGPATDLKPLGVFLGADKRDNALFFKGIIDEVEIFTRELSQAEVQALFDAGPAGKAKSDIMPPDVVCQNITVQLDAAGMASVDPEDIDGGTTDDSGDFTLSITAGTTSYDCDDTDETYTVTLTATDAAGNTASCDAEVTVSDDDLPDDDCDGVANICDLCDGGDDSVDNNGDNLPDCAFPPECSDILPAWKCGKKVKVCHIPPGNPQNANTLCVSCNAVAAHIAHGDYLGPCGSAPCGQNLFVPGGLQSGIFSAADFLSLEIFPNAANNRVNIHLHGLTTEAELSIHDAFGRLVFIKNWDESQDEFVLDLTENRFGEGIYLVSAVSEGERVSRRLVVLK